MSRRRLAPALTVLSVCAAAPAQDVTFAGGGRLEDVRVHGREWKRARRSRVRRLLHIRVVARVPGRNKGVTGFSEIAVIER